MSAIRLEIIDPDTGKATCRDVLPSELPTRGTLPRPSDGPEIHPGDFVVLVTRDPFLIGNHPQIAQWASEGTHLPVVAKQLRLLNETEKKYLECDSDYEVVVASGPGRKPFVFWGRCVVKVEPKSIKRVGLA